MLLVEVYCLDLEVDADRVEKVLIERVILQGRTVKHKHQVIREYWPFTYSVSDEQATLADATVANKQHLEQVVATQIK